MFVGLLFGGETVLLPAIYFGISGAISLQAVIAISVLATAISDTFWYYLGCIISVEKIASISIFKKHAKKVMRLSHSFQENGLILLFFSKFVYGTRTAMQILCGVNRIAFAKYFFVNISGILALNTLFIVLSITVEKSFESLVTSPHRLWLALGTFAICATTLQILFKKLLWKKWLRS